MVGDFGTIRNIMAYTNNLLQVKTLTSPATALRSDFGSQSAIRLQLNGVKCFVIIGWFTVKIGKSVNLLPNTDIVATRQ